jgi:hypothetical protein
VKSLRTIVLISLLGVVISLAVVSYFIFWGSDHIQVTGQSLPELLDSGALITIISIPVILIVTGLAMLPFLRTLVQPEIKNGVTAQAKVVKVWDTGVTVNDNPQIGLLLEVSPVNEAPFQSEIKTIVSRLNVSLIQPGTSVQIKYDPTNPKRIQILDLDLNQEASSGVEYRLKELDELYEKGFINKEEYDKKRQEIIDKI